LNLNFNHILIYSKGMGYDTKIDNLFYKLTLVLANKLLLYTYIDDEKN